MVIVLSELPIAHAATIKVSLEGSPMYFDANGIRIKSNVTMTSMYSTMVAPRSDLIVREKRTELL